MLRPKALHHVALTVADMDKTLHFYQALGFTLLRTSGPDAEQIPARPGIFREAGADIFRRAGIDDEQHVGGAFQRSAEDHEPVLGEGVHEGGVRRPLRLAFQRLGLLPGRATRANHREDRHARLRFCRRRDLAMSLSEESGSPHDPRAPRATA